MINRPEFVRYGLALVLLTAKGAVAYGQLPPESALPGEIAPPTALPSESELPGSAAQLTSVQNKQHGVQQPPDTDSAAQDAGEDDTDRRDADNAEKLPDESALPPGQPDRGDGELALEGPDGIPWLRLNLPGHTAPLRAVTFSSDGKRIFSAGDDKSLLAWTADPAAPNKLARWSYQRTVRWQIQRGTRGRVNALAMAPDFIAMAGEGAMGGNGEILLINPRSGELEATLVDLDVGHRQVIVGLSATADGSVVASQSIDGTLVQWTKNAAGLWRASRLRAPDVDVHAGNQQLAPQLQLGRSFSQIAALGPNKVVAGVYSRRQQNRTIWRLQLYDSAQGKNQPLAAEASAAPHWDHVTAMAVARQGQLLASADGGGHVYLWDLSGPRVTVRRLPRFSAPIISLSFDEAGNTLALGSAASPDNSGAWIEIWQVQDRKQPRRRERIATAELVRSCALSRDGTQIGWTNGTHVGLGMVGGQTDQHALRPGASPPLKVAFSAQKPFYRLGIGKQQAEGKVPIQYAFDTSLLRLDQLNQPNPEQWQSGGLGSHQWSLRQTTQPNGRAEVWSYEGSTRRSRLPLKWYESLRAQSWIPDREIPGQQPAKRRATVAVGTGSGTIILFDVGAEAAAPVIRRFRGHTAPVTSLAVSQDRRYLASSSLDGTVRVWPLANLREDSPLVQRWGAELAVQNDALVANEVRADGPLHFRGLRQGDRIEQIRFTEGSENRVRVASDPAEIRRALQEIDWYTIVTFRYARGRQDAEEFQLFPAWQQLVTLFVADNGQWAYWAPSGYYDASFEGHKLFGWQVNRGLDLLPDFFLAAQFRKQLERPPAMSRLLQAGNLEDAFRIARIEPPANTQSTLVNVYRLKPQVTILSPQADDVVEGQATVRALLSVDASQRLAPPKAFANGVVAVKRQLLSETLNDGRRESEYQWELSLPSDQRVLLQVTAATESEISASDQVVVDHHPPARADARMFLLSVGVDNYRDAQIPKLTTAVESTHQLLDVMQENAASIYRLDAASLLDERATKASWRLLTKDFSTNLSKDVSPDDLLVIFLSGHGVRSTDEAGYHFITANARYSDVLAGKYADCLSFADLSAFAEVPCRKLVILNTCHGGSVQPLMHREMKSVIRELQDDLLLTLSASGGEQEAVEGRFSRRLMEALRGAADANSDGIVAFGETVRYVQQTVAADSRTEPVRQFPTAGPQELLPYATFALSATDKLDPSSRRLGHHDASRPGQTAQPTFAAFLAENRE